VVVVIDDVQWLDAPTASAASFAFRRLDVERVGLLLALRTDEPDGELPLELSRARMPAESLPLGGLSVGAMHRMLVSRLGTSFSHQTLTRVHAESGGNPFIALEIGRALARRGVFRVATGSLPVPDTLTDLIGERLRALPAPVAAALGVIAVLPAATVSRCLAAGVAASDLDAAVLAGVVEVESGRVRFSHPLLASAVLGAIPPGRRKELHDIAARTATEGEERVRHLALATDAPSAAIAADLDQAARAAELRGAPSTAAELLELAAAKTPEDLADEAHRLLLRAGSQLGLAGETRAADTVFRRVADTAPPGPRRAEALAHLAWNTEDDFGQSVRLLEEALALAGDEPALNATIHLYLSDMLTIVGERTRSSLEVHRALEYAERSHDPALIASVLAQLFYTDWALGVDVDEALLDRALELERDLDVVGQMAPPSFAAGLYLVGMRRLDEARQAFERALARAEAEGVEYTRSDALLRLSVIATRTGNPRRGAELAHEGLDVAEQLDRDQLTSALLYGCAFAALHLGETGTVREIARRAMDLSAKAGDKVYLRAHQALCCVLDMALGDYAAAAPGLRELTQQPEEMSRRFYTDCVPEAVEALIGIGELDRAQVLLDDLRRRYRDPATAALAAYCGGMMLAARGELDQAAAELAEALRLHDEVTAQPVQIGRSLLALGAVQRRRKQRRSARETLQRALALFDGAEAALWADRARQELARVSGRPAAAGELTSTELRVAELIAGGASNKAAAAELFVTVRTIESTLTKVYAKLGVTSRTQLTARLRQR
jgi:ATP/maltotriose-dependent transcriptional regulator MalT